MNNKIEEIKTKFTPNQNFAFHTLSVSEKVGDCIPLFYGISKEDVEWLIKQAEKVEELTKANTELNKEIGSYSGTVEALTEEFSMLTGRMKVLKNKMLGE